MNSTPLYIGGENIFTEQTRTICNPYNNEVVATVCLATPKELEMAIAIAEQSFTQTRTLEPYERAQILEHIAKKLQERLEEFALVLTQESGKTIRESRAEILRAISVFHVAAGEAERIYGESYDAGITAAAKGRRILVHKFPIGPIAAISPFNFPLNLAVHKVAPAIATGCPVVLKPASATPLTALLLSEIIHETALPKGAFSCVPCTREAGQMLVTDNRFKLLSFTGSPEVGWKMKADAGKKPVVLELGGNAAVIVDSSIEDWDYMIERITTGAFYQSGQVCISVQNVFVHEDVYSRFVESFIEHVTALQIGDPKHETTDVGPIIDQGNCVRLQEWITEATTAGATLLCGGTIEGNTIRPTVLENTPKHCKIHVEEAFGPVVNIYAVNNMEDAIKQANTTKFGLQVGIFSTNFATIQRVFNTMEVGGVIVNDVPSFRVDHMPYGGIKDSGLGREGVKYAMEDMLEQKTMVYFSE